MANDFVTIMDMKFLNISKNDLFQDIIYPRLHNNEKTYLVTANPEIVMLAKEKRDFRDMVSRADYIVPDGTGIVIASKIIKQPIEERIPGFEIMTELIGYAEENQLSCYFIGAEEQVNRRFITKIKELHPNLLVAGSHHGFFDLNDRHIVDSIKRTEPDLVFVALGAPRQDAWITKYYDELDKGLFMGVGGSFDVIAGNVKRAPEIWIRFNLEWLYRLIKQPFRWKRILKVFEFMIRIVLKKY
ncbi:WecB/TagA/CpsF family glycosyltransferase [Aquibacillus koreensis]|uniref:N-acetylglucosaminyldiphosphoundecaprenol N-acetyl-beta-D-mannosaminyltransferase n=1 Tax=Aquibacillus koreensis TaxID=279446 RepID=A0A9X4AIX5_9BACI|nr:WecB/TagA/CpsF family glycosyltransferase [Aquibacillus koreensis]MCT2535285.1 WecB/TagA/CpsF family glycosyltransferase [Aquibacillus koreensis]MDC3419783.1 WecB/TagA/CpsF family glycosyltransferase [Aquibacillus koreensis]